MSLCCRIVGLAWIVLASMSTLSAATPQPPTSSTAAPKQDAEEASADATDESSPTVDPDKKSQDFPPASDQSMSAADSPQPDDSSKPDESSKPGDSPTADDAAASEVSKSTEDPDSDTSMQAAEVPNALPAAPKLQLKLPPALPDGRPLYPIGIFESQMVELIPDTYRPVSMERLGTAVKRLTDRATDDQASRLRGSEYWVELIGDTLVSKRSLLDLESDRDAVVRRSLGRVNLAIDPSSTRSIDAASSELPRLESGPDGNLVAVFQGGASRQTRIEFGWQLHGRDYGNGNEFLIRLPRTPQTRIVLAAPPDLEIQALDGVLRTRPGPPADAGENAKDSDARWYSIDAGGLSTVRIRTSPREAPNVESPLIVRRSLIQYDVEPSGLQWIQRMSVQLPVDQPLPKLRVFDATVVSIKINALEVPFDVKRRGQREHEITVDLPSGSINPQAAATTITITGQSFWDDWCQLPIARWVGDRIINASAVDEVQLAVAAPLELVDWNLPPHWNQSEPQWVDGIHLCAASGPPVDHLSSTLQGDLATAWSAVRFAQQPQLQTSETWLRLEVQKSALIAKARITIAVDATRLAPVRLKIQDDFSIDSLTLAHSQRSIESLHTSDANNALVIWPESDDVSPASKDTPAQLTIDITGTRVLPNGSAGLEVPSAWFARLEDVRGNFFASIVSPDNLNWSGEAALKRDRIRAADLAKKPLAFLSGGERPTLYFASQTGRTPEVLLETPSVSFNVSTLLRMSRDGDEVVEELTIDVESAGQTLEQILVQTGPAGGRPMYHWALKGEDGIPSTSLPPSDVQLGGDPIATLGPPQPPVTTNNSNPDLPSVDSGGVDSGGVDSASAESITVDTVNGESDLPDRHQEGVYTIDVSELNLRGRRLIARRRYPMKKPTNLQLPSVPGAASQRSEVLIESGLQVHQKSSSVQLVPVIPTPSSSGQPNIVDDESGSGDRTAGETAKRQSDESTTDNPAADIDTSSPDRRVREPSVVHQRLRYDAVEQPSIVLALSDDDGSVNLVWRESVRVIASSRGTDRIEATYLVSSTSTLQIQYDPNMQLASIHRNGEPINLLSIPQRPIELPPARRGHTSPSSTDEVETIEVVWNRTQYGSHWMRHCQIPSIGISAIVLKSDYHLVPSADTFSPTALLRNRPEPVMGAALYDDSLVDDTIDLMPGDTVILIRRNVALAIGWLISLAVFAAGWWISIRSPLIVAVMVAVMTSLTLLWWPWKLAVIGWLIVPAIAAAMLTTSRAWTDRGSRLDKDSYDKTSSGGRGDASQEISWAAIVRSILLGMFISGSWILSQGLVFGQDSGTTNTPRTNGAASDSAAKKNGSTSNGSQTNGKTATESGTGNGRSPSLPPTAIQRSSLATQNGPPGQSVGVLVPVKDDGSISSEIVYIPGNAHTLLFAPETLAPVQTPYFQSADYRVRIDSATPVAATENREPAMAEYTVEAEYTIHLVDGDRGSNQVHFPISFTSVRRVELVEEVDRIIRFTADDAGKLIASLPRGNVFRLRVTMAGTTSPATPWRKLLLTIPPVASTRLTIEAEDNIAALRVGGPQGRLLPETDLRRWTTELGPADALEIEYRVSGNSTLLTPQPLRRRYWINAGKLRTVIECEVDPPTAIAAGETFQFVIRDAEMPLVTSPNWRLAGTELYSAARRLVTVVAHRDAPGPIRLLWSRPRIFSDQDPNGLASSQPTDDRSGVSESGAPLDEDDNHAIVLPEVIAAALGENAPAWVAFHWDRSLNFIPMADNPSEPLSVDQFMAAWSGYRGLIDRALVATGSVPSLTFQDVPVSGTQVQQRHHLHVLPDRLELQFDATVVPGDASTNRLRLAVPSSMELVNLSVNGVQQESSATRSGAVLEFLLGDFSPHEPVAVHALAVESLPPNRMFNPPRFQLTPAAEITETYSISRDGSAELRVVRPVPLTAETPTPQPSAKSLAQGWIPVSTWTIADAGSMLQHLGGQFHVRPRRTRFDCRQLVSLARVDGRWRMETHIKFDSKRFPDFIDVEVPTRWCEGLEVSPTTSWSRQPATDSSNQIIRIRCDAAELPDQHLTIVGNLQNSDAGRVGVPNVRVLGFGERRVHISVPDRLTNESIQWRTSVVEAVELPMIWRDVLSRTEPRSTYLAASPAWSIDLAPLPTIHSDAVALTQDNQAFAQSDGLLVMSHWDFFPGGLESIRIRVPAAAKCLGGWSGGQPVVVELEEDARRGPDDESKVVRMPLALSRMSQTVELLFRVPADIGKRGKYIAQLVDIPVTQSWLTVYEPVENLPSGFPFHGNPVAASDHMSPQQRRRSVSLARSVVESVEHAVDSIAERPSEEVAAWLSPWILRYRKLAASAGHTVDFSITDDSPDSVSKNGANPKEDAAEDQTRDSKAAAIASDDSLAGSAVTPGMLDAKRSKEISMQWRLLDQRVAVYVNRYLPDQPFDGTRNFDDWHYDGYRTSTVTQLSLVNQPTKVQTVSTSDRGLRNLMVNLLTLASITGLILCLRPLRRFVVPVVVHPAFWLGLMGIFGFAVAPTPVAAAVVLVAVLTSLFPPPRSKHASVSDSI
ncbi:hypothetical protein K227x_19380 [Rubripirellula lacrimiformis]|uniref:Uncharacterized protein n=1 Tax=Rubripirellula lacrimiformis TaxID=1930273 RepID=A0A517N8U1_9BACT|nr:hypothetical protein [Rubripirellula lacrimiformis]QDT03554.1 hypothetical protein K227x_19380 [Rubripirellula lacrimiformis]